MDDLLALDGGSAARKWQNQHGKRKRRTEISRRRRKAQADREALYDREQRRRARIAKIEKSERAEWVAARKANGYTVGLPFKDLTGRRFGRLKVIRPGGHNPSGSKRWWVKCSCGSPTKEVAGTNLQQGILRSCGCLVGDALRKAGAQKRAARATKTRRCLRSEMLRWVREYAGGRGDRRLLSRMKELMAKVEVRAALVIKS